MNKNIMKLFISLSLTLIFSTGCSGYLDLTPEDDLVQDEFWQNKEQVASAVAGCYASLNEKAFNERVLLWGEARAEMMVSVSASSNAQNMMMNYMVPTNSYVNWSNFYKTINYCNTVLAFAGQAKELDATFSDFDYKRYMSEVTAIRSMVYFILVKNFKDVPYVVDATLSDQSNFYPSKSSEKDVLAYIISDLLSIVGDLPETDGTSVQNDKGRMNKAAVYALLADIYLWNEQYDECIAACQSIIDMQKYTLVDGENWFSSIFFEGNSSEGIFELQFDDIFSTLVTYFYYGNPDVKAYTGILDLYSDNLNDKRAHLATYDAKSSSIFKFAGADARSGEYRASSQFYNNWIFYRYPEVLLMQAEAYTLSTTQRDYAKAYQLTNDVYMRATSTALDASETQSSLLTAILLERQREFAFEGKRWYDLLRFARRDNFADQQLILSAAESTTTASNYEAVMSFYADTASYFLPIYQNELDLNYNLEQNPYYLN